MSICSYSYVDPKLKRIASNYVVMSVYDNPICLPKDPLRSLGSKLHNKYLLMRKQRSQTITVVSWKFYFIVLNPTGEWETISNLLYVGNIARMMWEWRFLSLQIINMVCYRLIILPQGAISYHFWKLHIFLKYLRVKIRSGVSVIWKKKG